jgi:hypothetical protein
VGAIGSGGSGGRERWERLLAAESRRSVSPCATE